MTNFVINYGSCTKKKDQITKQLNIIESSKTSKAQIPGGTLSGASA